MSALKQVSKDWLTITARVLFAGLILLSAITLIACGSDNETRTLQNPAPPVGNSNNSSVAAGNPTEPQPPIATTNNRNVARERPLNEVNRNVQPRTERAEANISGTWQSPVGRVSVTQDISTINATVFYMDGSGTASINGKLNGRALSFKWSDRSGKGLNGTGNARVSPDGRTISGTVRLSDGRSQPFVLSR